MKSFLSVCIFLSLCAAAHGRAAGRKFFARRVEKKYYRKLKQIKKPGKYSFSLIHDGKVRKYILYVPGKYFSSAGSPVLFVFHGGGGNAELMAGDEFYGFVSGAEKHGYLAVFPNGASRFRGRLATWNAGECCGYARDSRSDDVGFVERILSDLTKNLKIDKSGVFAAGMSNGAMFSYRLACELSGGIRAIAAVAGTDNYRGPCRLAKPVSVFHIHAADDDHVLFGGGAGKGAFRDGTKVTEFSSVPDTFRKWADRNGCKGPPETFKEGKGVYCKVYEECDAGSKVKLCVTPSGGHSWPGGRPPRRKSPRPFPYFNATEEIWKFFQSLSP